MTCPAPQLSLILLLHQEEQSTTESTSTTAILKVASSSEILYVSLFLQLLPQTLWHPGTLSTQGHLFHSSLSRVISF